MNRHLPSILGAAVVLVSFFALPDSSPAEPLRGKLLQKQSTSASRPRSPNDQIEGTIWTYKVSPTGSKSLEGRFRVEGDGVFAVDRVMKTPFQPSQLRNALGGQQSEIKLPNQPQQKRIGDLKKISGNRYRIDFFDDQPFTGMMIVWQPDRKSSHWIGDFRELNDGHYGEKWDVDLRPSED